MVRVVLFSHSVAYADSIDYSPEVDLNSGSTTTNSVNTSTTDPLNNGNFSAVTGNYPWMETGNGTASVNNSRFNWTNGILSLNQAVSVPNNTVTEQSSTGDTLTTEVTSISILKKKQPYLCCLNSFFRESEFTIVQNQPPARECQCRYTLLNINYLNTYITDCFSECYRGSSLGRSLARRSL